jgi:hypothetical protein
LKIKERYLLNQSIDSFGAIGVNGVGGGGIMGFEGIGMDEDDASVSQDY